MEDTHRAFLPAAGRDWLLPLYDPFVKLLGGDAARRALLDQAALEPTADVLDLGCGTGTLVVLIAQRYPKARVVGVDPDPRALARARRKARRGGVLVALDEGYADSLAYPDGSFDRVFSSFMLHHLEPGDKVRALREARRVLRDGGSLHLLDFVTPEHREASGFVRWAHSHHRLKDNTEAQVLELLREAGFSAARTVSRGALLMGRTACYEARTEDARTSDATEEA